MPARKTPLINDYVYHILNRGVNHIPIFNDARDYQRFLALTDYCRHADYPVKFSSFKILPEEQRLSIKANLKENFIEIIAYVLMPNHFHFVLRQKKENGITNFMNRLLTSYTKFFNTRHERSGPLFEGRFGSILVETEEQLLHLVRYLHLNPHSSIIVKTMSDLIIYPWSSLPEYLNKEPKLKICTGKQTILSQFSNLEKFLDFVSNQADYQRKLNQIKHLIKERIS